MACKRLTDIELHRRFDPAVFAEFLGTFPEYLQKRGLVLPSHPTAKTMPYDEIIGLFVHIDNDTPEAFLALASAVYNHCHRRMRGSIFSEAKRNNIKLDLPRDLSVYDFVMLVRLRYPKIFEAARVRVVMKSQRRYVYFRPFFDEMAPVKIPGTEALATFERNLQSWFRAMDRGVNGVRLFMYEEPNQIWFLIRHGDYLERLGVLDENGEPKDIFFRPEKYDVVVFDKVTGMLKIRCKWDSMLHQYRMDFGRFLFQDTNFFSAKRGIFTLQPLLDNDFSFQQCANIDGIRSLALAELFYETPGIGGEFVKRKSKCGNLLAGYDPVKHGSLIPAVVDQIAYAKFNVTYEGSTQPHVVTVKMGNETTYCREDDVEALERWMMLFGFMDCGAKVVSAAA